MYKCKKIFNLLVIPLQSEFSLVPMAFSVNHYLVTLPKNQLKSGRYVLAELLSLPFEPNKRRREERAKQERDPRRRHRRHHRGRHHRRGLSQRWPSSSPTKPRHQKMCFWNKQIIFFSWNWNQNSKNKIHLIKTTGKNSKKLKSSVCLCDLDFLKMFFLCDNLEI